MPSNRSLLVTRLAAIVVSAGALAMAGCGMGTTASPTNGVIAGLSGKVFGGSQPISGATVTLYATGSNGYGAGATSLASTTTNQFGGFVFPNNGYSCPTGQQVYVTTVGGNTGAGVNNNAVLVAALGSCSFFTTSQRANINVWVDEVTTVAAAYTLNNFATVSGAAGSQAVNIGAPVNANSITGSCVNTAANIISSCTTASLTHAFQNAQNLASASNIPVTGNTLGAAPTGTAYTVTPSNTAGSVPQALINSLANATAACVNSTGAASTQCSTLFTNATPPGGTAPTDTFSALMNIARYPTQNVLAILNIAPGTGTPYQPSLVTVPYNGSTSPATLQQPADLSLAIVYTGLGTTGTQFTYPFYLTLDINDNVYSTNQTGSSTAASTGATETSLASNGAPGSTNTGVSTLVCAAGSPCLAQADSLGNLWIANTNGTTNPNIYKFNTANLATAPTVFSLTSKDAPNGVAINPLNTVYVTSSLTTNSNGNLFFLRQASGDTTFANLQYNNGSANVPVAETVAPEYVAIDSSLDVINVNYTSTSTATTYLPNTVTTNVTTTQPTFGAPVNNSLSTTNSPYSVEIDGSNNEWANSTKTLYASAKGATASSITATISGTNGSGNTVSASSARYGSLDGNGSIFMPDNNTTSSYLWYYVPNATAPATTAGTFFALNSCLAPNGATACQTSSTAGARPAFYGPRVAQVDSTGSVWIASSTNGSIVQVLGVGAPTWPLLAYAKPGTKPQ